MAVGTNGKRTLQPSVWKDELKREGEKRNGYKLDYPDKKEVYLPVWN